MKVTMTQVKTTKGTHVYGADVPNGPIRTLYIEKSVASTLGDRIVVTVETNTASVDVQE